MSSYPISENSWATKSQLLASNITQDHVDALRASPLPDTQVEPECLEPPSGQGDNFDMMMAANELQHEPRDETLGQLISRPIESIEDISDGFSFATFSSKPALPKTYTDRHPAAQNPPVHTEPQHRITNAEPLIAPSTMASAPRSQMTHMSPISYEAPRVRRSPIARPTKDLSKNSEASTTKASGSIETSLTSGIPQNSSNNNDPQVRQVPHSSEGSDTTSRPSTSRARVESLRLELEQGSQIRGNAQISSKDGGEIAYDQQHKHNDGHNNSEHEQIDEPDFHHHSLQTATHHHHRDKYSRRGVSQEQVSQRMEQATRDEACRSRDSNASFPITIPHHGQNAEVHADTPRSHKRTSSIATHRTEQSNNGPEVIDLPWQSHASQPYRHRRRVRAGQEHGTANRPLDKSRPNEPSLRPNSQNSNISKTRVPAKHHGRHASPAESSRHRDSTAPTHLRKAASRNHRTLVNSWNRYFSTHYEQQDALEKEISDLKADLEECSDVIAQLEEDALDQAKAYHHQINMQSNTINKLRAEGSDLRTHLAQSKTAFSEKEERYETLVEKCRQYKDCFNKAIAEHQQLYTKTKQNFKNIVAQIKEEFEAEQKDKDKIIREILDQTESIRTSFRKRANLTDREAKHQFLTMANTIKALKVELAERQRELTQERQNSEMARDELEQARDKNAQALEDLSAQNTKILETMESHYHNSQESTAVTEGIGERLDSLCQSMNDLQQLMPNPAVLTDDISSLGQDITTLITTKFGDLGSRISDIDCGQKNHSPKIDRIVNVCRAIDERMQNEDGVAYWQSKCQEADQNLRMLEEHTRRVQGEVDVASRHNQDLSATNDNLIAEVTSLQNRIGSLQESLQAAGKNAAVNDGKIKQLLSVKDAEITELQSKLEHCKIDQEKLQQDLRARDDDKLTLMTTHQDEVDGLQRKCATTENQLEATENARGELAKELQVAKNKIEDLSKNDGAEQVITFLKEEIRVLSEVVKEQKRIDTKLENTAAYCHAGDVRLAALAKQYDVLTKKYSEASKENDDLAEMKSQYIELYQKVSRLSISGADTQETALTPAMDTEEMSRMRRVTVKSPVEEPVPAAPSIEEERDRRRSSVPRKSNLRATAHSNLAGLQTAVETKTSSSQENAIEEQAFVDSEPVDLGKRGVFSNRSSFNRPVRGGNPGDSAVTTNNSDKKRRKLSEVLSQQASAQSIADYPQDERDSLFVPKRNTRSKSGKSVSNHMASDGDLNDEDGANVREYDAPRSSVSYGQSKRLHRNSFLVTYGNQNQDLPVQTASASSQPISATTIAPAGSKRKRSASIGS
ncbi:hypothetical protein PFICI_14345 [Pestalotiopsis fici W106-1]|uniref:Uncharacterized protein n=1 Tax=Pestalotiopsis fici (strain W106-1 / CGMCC3.15140) TaxID=1229662 RepID=W3WL50_PESFW|nr:uncharacterized protein PFICI_14345 [Pestalotiopsis fici W106-1]ETS74479.1 hypothetical protein PFICI_14345 [Pestalotiopsis fici W106-1]